jgi:hypothetical protein
MIKADITFGTQTAQKELNPTEDQINRGVDEHYANPEKDLITCIIDIVLIDQIKELYELTKKNVT